MEENINKNLLLHQIILDGDKTFFQEVIPPFVEFSPAHILSLDSSQNLIWTNSPKDLKFQEGNGIFISNFNGKIKIDASLNFDVIENDKIKGTQIYYKDGKIGIGRSPLYTYKFDIAVPENTLMTAFHVGDGKYGFSMGNGTTQGFIPEIIGMGSDENDAGLYFLGKAGNNVSSDIPLIIIDGRSHNNSPLKNRPIIGITNGNYSKYEFLIDQEGRVGIGKIPKIYKLEIEGSIQADDIVIENLSLKLLISVIKEHQEEIDKLKDIIERISK